MYEKKERQILKALTLAKSFASPPLAAIVNTLDTEPAANPIVYLEDVFQLYMTINALEISSD